MRLKYFLSITLAYAVLILIGFQGGSIMLCAALALWIFAVGPLIDYYFIRKRNLDHGESLRGQYPFFWKYRFDLLFKKDVEEGTTASETK